MSIDIRDKEVKPSIPQPKEIIIGGQACGVAQPHIDGDRLRWHVVITLPSEDSLMGSILVQGHGGTVRSGIADGIVSARGERDSFAKRLAWLEKELGTSHLTADQIRANASKVES